MCVCIYIYIKAHSIVKKLPVKFHLESQILVSLSLMTMVWMSATHIFIPTDQENGVLFVSENI